MADHVHSSFSAEQRLAIAKAMREHLAKCGRPRKDLVRPGLGSGTINKAMLGDFTDNTLAKIEAALGCSFRPENIERTVHREAPKDAGGYPFSTALCFHGEYLCVRPAFSDPKILIVYLIDIRWDDTKCCLVFEERNRPDPKHTQKGIVYLPLGKPFMNLVTIDTGSIRTITVSHPDENGVARGIITTLHNPRGTLLTPVSAPVVLRRSSAEEAVHGDFVKPGMFGYDIYRSLIDSVTAEEYAKLVANADQIARTTSVPASDPSFPVPLPNAAGEVPYLARDKP